MKEYKTQEYKENFKKKNSWLGLFKYKKYMRHHKWYIPYWKKKNLICSTCWGKTNNQQQQQQKKTVHCLIKTAHVVQFYMACLTDWISVVIYVKKYPHCPPSPIRKQFHDIHEQISASMAGWICLQQKLAPHPIKNLEVCFQI